MNGCVIMQGEKSLAEKYWTPYDAHTLHRLYSSTKSFVAMAMCFAFMENQVGVKMTRSAQFFFDEYQGYTGGPKA